jgi:hypothetical protein
LHRLGLRALGILPLALAWGLLCHVVGDVVTPAGIQPLLPISDWTLRLPLGRFGEPIIVLAELAAFLRNSSGRYRFQVGLHRARHGKNLLRIDQNIQDSGIAVAVKYCHLVRTEDEDIYSHLCGMSEGN